MKQLKSLFVTTYMNWLVYWYVHFQSSIAQQRESSLRWIKQCPMHWTIGNHKSWSRWAKHSLHEFVQRKSSYIFHLFTALITHLGCSRGMVCQKNTDFIRSDEISSTSMLSYLNPKVDIRKKLYILWLIW